MVVKATAFTGETIKDYVYARVKDYAYFLEIGHRHNPLLKKDYARIEETTGAQVHELAVMLYHFDIEHDISKVLDYFRACRKSYRVDD